MKRASRISAGVLTTLLVMAMTTTPSNTPTIYPINQDQVTRTSEYGMRMHPTIHVKKMHTGVDYVAPLGTKVVSTADGVVEKVEFEKTKYGHRVIIKHSDSISTSYAHLDKILVKEGQEVTQGVVIATVGNTGASTGPHLHYEVLQNGKAVNPNLYIKK